MTSSAKTLRALFPSRHPFNISKHAWYYESPKSILLVAEFDTQPPGAVQVRIPLRKLEQFCKRAHAAALKREPNAAVNFQTMALKMIAEWDCLNPPRPDLLGDLPWLKRLVDRALAGNDPRVETAPQAGQDRLTAPSQEGHAAGPAPAAPVAEIVATPRTDAARELLKASLGLNKHQEAIGAIIATLEKTERELKLGQGWVPERPDLVLVTRTFLQSLECPVPNCSGGWITNTGPDPQHDSCPWCEARGRFLAGDLPPVPGASDD